MEENLKELPFNSTSVYYKYKCKDCGLETQAEDIAIDAFLAGGQYKAGEMPKLGCPRCSGTLLYIGY